MTAAASFFHFCAWRQFCYITRNLLGWFKLLQVCWRCAALSQLLNTLILACASGQAENISSTRIVKQRLTSKCGETNAGGLRRVAVSWDLLMICGRKSNLASRCPVNVLLLQWRRWQRSKMGVCVLSSVVDGGDAGNSRYIVWRYNTKNIWRK